MKWKVEPLQGKFYGTVVSDDDGHEIKVWIGFEEYTPEEVSDREKARGWGQDEIYYAHAESRRDYFAALVIAEALNKANV